MAKKQTKAAPTIVEGLPIEDVFRFKPVPARLDDGKPQERPYLILPGNAAYSMNGESFEIPGTKLVAQVPTQKELEWAYNLAPGMIQWIIAPKGYLANWEKA